MFKGRVLRETRTCAHPDCSNTFEVRIAATRKFCCVSCGSKGRTFSAEFKRNRSANQKKQWQDLEYKRIQHEARLGNVGGWNKNLTKETDSRVAAQAEKITGISKSEESNEKRSKRLKGVSYVELYGEERAKEMIQIRSEAIQGEKNPWWQGGSSSLYHYHSNFTERFRERIRARDGYSCQLCSRVKEVLGRALSVHHIHYDGETNDCGSDKDFITLCAGCHGKINADREYWEMFFKSTLQESILV